MKLVLKSKESFALDCIPSASLLELLQPNQRRSHSTQDCCGATMQKHFLCRSPVFFSVTPLSLCDTSGVWLQRQQNCSPTCGHTFRQTKKRGCICKLPRLRTNTSAHTDTCATDGTAPRTDSLVCTTEGKHPYLLMLSRKTQEHRDFSAKI